MDKAWKQFERKVCSLFGGSRRGPSGKKESDCVDTPYAVSCKLRKNFTPSYLEDAEQFGKDEGKPWILVWRRPQKQKTYAMVDFYWLLDELGIESEKPNEQRHESNGEEED